MDEQYDIIRKTLESDLLAEIVQLSPTFFERLVIDLMEAMNYGVGKCTQQTRDGGIDGIIYQDKLGFDCIVVQAKKWALDGSVDRPELQRFCGAMRGVPQVTKGLFITTARFTAGAREYAANQHIILVDGPRLAGLLVEYGVGVSVEKTYTLKRIDNNYFSED